MCSYACTGCQSSSGSFSNSANFFIWWPLFNSQATLLIWSAHTVSLVRCGRPHRSFCQFRCTTWTLLLVVSLLLLQDSGTLFLWTVELLHLLTHLRPGLRHFSFLQHNLHCSTRLCTMARYKSIDWLIDWLIAAICTERLAICSDACSGGIAAKPCWLFFLAVEYMLLKNNDILQSECNSHHLTGNTLTSANCEVRSATLQLWVT